MNGRSQAADGPELTPIVALDGDQDDAPKARRERVGERRSPDGVDDVGRHVAAPVTVDVGFEEANEDLDIGAGSARDADAAEGLEDRAVKSRHLLVEEPDLRLSPRSRR